MRHLYRMLKDILTIAGAEMEPAEHEKNTRIESDNAALISGLLAFLLYGLVYVILRFLDYFFYLCWLYAAVFYKIFKGEARNMAAYRVERRYCDHSRSVVHKDLYACYAFEGFDVAASLPIILPFISSEGILTAVDIMSEATELAMRCMDMARIS